MASITVRCLALIAFMSGAGVALGLEFEMDDMGRPNMSQYLADKEAREAAEAKQAAKEAKMAAVKKVVSMLEELREQVLAEGEEEAKTYNTFACFCKDMTAEKTKAIEGVEDEKTDIVAKIEKLQDKRDDLDKEMKKLEGDIEDLEDKMKKAEKKRAKELKLYTKNEADLSGALFALEGAIKELKAAKTEASFAQMQATQKTIQEAIAMADALGLATKRAQRYLAVFLQQSGAPSVPTKDYEFKSGDIITTLEDLEKDFRDEKVKVDADEVQAVADHDMFMQKKQNKVKAKNVEMETAKKDKAEKMEQISMQSAELSTISAQLLDDQQYLEQLTDMCHKRALTWDMRTKVRKGEINALTEAMGLLKDSASDAISGKTARLVQQRISLRRAEAVATDENAMESVEAAVESEEASGKPLSFLQRRSEPNEAGRQAVINLLRQQSKELRSSTLSTLASQLSEDKFAKIKFLIQELIERLLKEAANEANQKGWCDKATTDAQQKRDYAAEDIESLNSNLAKMEATRDELLEELKTLPQEISGLKNAMSTATAERKKEKAENKATVMESTAGLSAVQNATILLDRFYKTAAKAEVEMSLRAAKAKVTKNGAPAPAYEPYEPEEPPPPVDVAADAPDAGFDTGEAYTGAQGGKEGVIGMLEVIASDFERTIAETEAAEDEAEMEHLKFMTESGKSLAEKEVAEKELKKQKNDVVQKITDDNDDLDAKTKKLKGAISELLELKKACEDSGMSFQERVDARKADIAALKKAVCVLNQYEKYGPDGMAGGATC